MFPEIIDLKKHATLLGTDLDFLSHFKHYWIRFGPG